MGQPGGQSLGLEEVEDFARARRGVGIVSEADDLAGGFEKKAERGVVLSPFQVGVGVALGLAFGDGNILSGAVFLGLNHTDRSTAHK